jgi:hypothetical protein
MADNHVAWLRFTESGSIVTCDSDAEGAFKVYRHPYIPTMDEVYVFMRSNPQTSAEMLQEIAPLAMAAILQDAREQGAADWRGEKA